MFQVSVKRTFIRFVKTWWERSITPISGLPAANINSPQMIGSWNISPGPSALLQPSWGKSKSHRKWVPWFIHMIVGVCPIPPKARTWSGYIMKVPPTLRTTPWTVKSVARRSPSSSKVSELVIRTTRWQVGSWYLGTKVNSNTEISQHEIIYDP